jgi:hypothetical protein
MQTYPHQLYQQWPTTLFLQLLFLVFPQDVGGGNPTPSFSCHNYFSHVWEFIIDIPISEKSMHKLKEIEHTDFVSRGANEQRDNQGNRNRSSNQHLQPGTTQILNNGVNSGSRQDVGNLIQYAASPRTSRKDRTGQDISWPQSDSSGRVENVHSELLQPSNGVDEGIFP